jgi:hypothetical protein
VITVTANARRFYRLRTPATPDAPSVACSVRIDEHTGQLYLAVGPGRRRMYVTADEAWTLWRCLSEAVASLGEPPAHIRTNLAPSRRSS